LNQQRLHGPRQAAFLVWFEDHNEAIAIAPYLPRNKESKDPVDVDDLMKLPS